MALLVTGVEGDGAVKQRHHGFKTAGVVHGAGFETQFEGCGQKTQAFDVAADAEQAPAVVAGHAVGLGAGDGGQVTTGGFEQAQRVQRLVFVFAAVFGAAAQEFLFRMHDHLPVFFGQAFAHGKSGMPYVGEVAAHTAGHIGLAEAGHQRTLEHTTALGWHWHTGRQQHVVFGHLAQPVQQGG